MKEIPDDQQGPPVSDFFKGPGDGAEMLVIFRNDLPLGSRLFSYFFDTI
jgi:hypothetical protein